MSAESHGIRGPYPGLRPFERDEDDLFFGREEQIDQLMDKLDETHFLAVLGTSGSGKSSLVRAGLLPALDSGFMGAAGASWSIAQLRPGDQPFHRLADSLIRATEWGHAYAEATGIRASSVSGGAAGSGTPTDQAIAALEEDLRRGSMALNWRLGVQPLPEGTRLLILVDQFEELFRYHRTNRREAADFVALLLAAATHPDVYLVITLRSEFLGDCSLYPGLPEAINRGLFLTPSLTPEQMADAIQLPAELPQFGGSVDPALVRRLLEETRGQTDQLPLLQHALMRLWDLDDGDRVLTLTELQALGGLREALDAHVEEAFAELNREQQRIAEILFRGLTERGSAERDTRRPVRLGEVAALAGVAWNEVADVVGVFRRPGRSFLMPPAGTELTEDNILDITHEALIRQWKRLAGWTANEAEQAELYQRLEAAARRNQAGKGALWIDPDLQIALKWRDDHKPTPIWAARYGGDFDLAMEFLDGSLEAREEADRRLQEQRLQDARMEAKQKLLKRFLAVTSALTLIAIGAGVTATFQYEKAKEESLEAQRQLRETETQSARLAELTQQNNRLIAELKLQTQTAATATNKEGTFVASVNTEGRLSVIELASGTPVPLGDECGKVKPDRVVFSPAGKELALASGGDVWILHLDRDQCRRLAGDEARIRRVAFSPDGQLLASGGDFNPGLTGEAESGARGGICRVWDVATGMLVTDFDCPFTVIDIAFDGSGTKLICKSSDGEVLEWANRSGNFRNAVKETPVAAANIPRRLFIQIRSEAYKVAATAWQGLLEAWGVTVPGIEIVGDRSPRQSELRYFRKAEQAQAQEILDRLHRAGANVNLVYIRGYENSKNVRPLQFELWFADDTIGYWFPVVASIYDRQEALDRAGLLQATKAGPYLVQVYEAADLTGQTVYAVTLGGYMTKTEADTRVAYARKEIEPTAYKRESLIWRRQDP